MGDVRELKEGIEMPDSYMNRVLRVDLSMGSILKEVLGPELKQRFVGGMGFKFKKRIGWMASVFTFNL